MQKASINMTAKQRNRTWRSAFALCFLVIAVCLSAVLFAPGPAKAQCSSCGCVFAYHSNLRTYIFEMHETTRAIFGTAQPLPNTPFYCGSPAPTGTGRLGQHQRFLLEELFLGCSGEGGILPALMMMTEQFVSVMMHQAFIIGTFFDAKNQLETQLLFNDLMTQAHKDYHPSTGMCTIGTNVRSLGAANYNANLTNYTLGQRMLERQLGSANINASEGSKEDREGRLHQVENRFCDRNDNNPTAGISTGLGLICEAYMAPTEFVNADIDYSRIIDNPSTLEIDFANNNIAGDQDESDVLALASNLFSHDVFDRVRGNILGLEENETLYLDMRSIVAKRAVAQNSFNNIAALKTQGSAPNVTPGNSNNTAEYMTVMLQELGIPDEEIPMYLGDLADSGEIRPSYFAQLEVLGKLIYQNPSFYVDLYDKPANVKRKKTAMRAINSLIQREIYDSQLRSEAIMSVLLELSIARAQRDVQNELNELTTLQE